MATPFDHLPKFQKLPPEAQKQIMERFSQKPEEEKMQIMGKVGTPMSVQDNDPGLQPVEPVSDLMIKGTAAYKETAPDLENALIESGFNPKIAKAVGATFAHIPEIAGGAKSAIEVGPGLAKGAVSVGKSLKAGYTGVRDAIKGTGQKEVMALSEKAAELPIKQTATQEAALAAKQAAGKGIQAAEEKAGIGLSNTPSTVIRGNLKSPDKVVNFADRMERITKNGPEGLEKASTKVISHFRETTKAALKDKTLPQDVRIRLEKAQTVLNDSLSPRVPEVGQQVNKFKEAIKVLEGLGPQFKKEKHMLELALVKARNLAKTQQGIRTGAKWAAGGGAGGVATGIGYTIGKKLLGS